ncbi:DUF3810 domain-containing protein [Chryseobacterium oryzae]|uniref:DUF3810 domain-containing protein n=1 Tax=Chryseobacterium oryzae TaxID=2929799 RepID=A0ABY4BFB4_9FLAO|nr:DUF3810 domain-containing protein [Chryseobacterium oryzae]UOE37812.1 DUF3810 domain-containing protein [Chryseobacterium oryzae]
MTTKTYHKKKRIWAAILVVQFLLFYAFSKISFLISFFESFFEFQRKFHLLLFSWIPCSFGDIVYTVLGIVFLILMIQLLRKKTRSNAFLKILITVNIFYFLYQIFWGMLYFQTPIAAKLPKIEITLEARKKLALEYLEKAKATRKLINEDPNGIFIIKDLQSVQTEILSRQTILPAFITNKKALPVNSIKKSLYSKLMSFTGILGYYNPFTAEAQYNSNLPSSYLPFTIAHESSHQLGFAREQEANFIGYLIGVESTNNDLKYSTEYFTLKSLLNSIVQEDENFVKSMLNNYSDGMKRDRSYEKKFIKEHEGLVTDFFGFTNNLFLKSNQQEGSVTYSYFIDLLVRYKSMEAK